MTFTLEYPSEIPTANRAFLDGEVLTQIRKEAEPHKFDVRMERRAMPRIADPPEAAEPTSDRKSARYVRVLAAAAKLGSENELERVRMHEVAELAGVAVSTLYRYFPSKTHLFVGVMAHQIDQMGRGLWPRTGPVDTPQEAVYQTLVQATRALLCRPLLANAMIYAMGTARASVTPDVAEVDRRFGEILYRAARLDVDRAAETDAALVRVLLYTWLGSVQRCLSGRSSVPDAEADLRVACELILVRLSTATDSPTP